MTFLRWCAVQIDRPELSLPAAEATAVRTAYEQARVILEYGSGGSTVMAAEMRGKLILSVESDKDWALRMQLYLDGADTVSPATVYPVDIGETGAWGRPTASTSWTHFHRYALAIWDESFFRHPDVILIDGRFRPACLMTALMRIERPVTVLFDDYADRKRYHIVEDVVQPDEMVGRMAVFRIAPDSVPKEATTRLIESFTQASFAEQPAMQLAARDKPS